MRRNGTGMASYIPAMSNIYPQCPMTSTPEAAVMEYACISPCISYLSVLYMLLRAMSSLNNRPCTCKTKRSVVGSRAPVANARAVTLPVYDITTSTVRPITRACPQLQHVLEAELVSEASIFQKRDEKGRLQLSFRRGFRLSDGLLVQLVQMIPESLRNNRPLELESAEWRR